MFYPILPSAGHRNDAWAAPSLHLEHPTELNIGTADGQRYVAGDVAHQLATPTPLRRWTLIQGWATSRLTWLLHTRRG